MPSLTAQQRRTLENTVKAARRQAEDGARAALDYLGVAEAEPPAHLTPPQRRLRVRLRAHALQLGDGQRGRAFPALRRITHEVAYEHWHRMLFARFLAENGLLLTPEGDAMSLDEAAELAAEENLDLWTYAARCAQTMLPQVFRADDPALALDLARNDRAALEQLVAGLPAEIFRASDALGWVYQYWRAEEKDAVNHQGDKINADTLPAVTQLFTEPYMVAHLIDNTLGAWWAGKLRNSSPEKLTAATSEEDARRTIALSTVEWSFLRLVQDADGTWRPAAGTFPGWPQRVRELRLLDPSCGSGHFLAALLPILAALLQAEEGLSIREALPVILGEILHGLELDGRCSQLAAFNVALTAWRLAGEVIPLPPLNIACTGLSLGAEREDWLQTAEPGTQRFLIGQLYDLFKQAPDLGSLINPAHLTHIGENATALLPQLRSLLSADADANPDLHELGVTAKGLADAIQLLSSRFHLVITNVPYLGRGKQGDTLGQHLETRYPTAKADLATAFVLRCLEFCAPGGSTALVTPQNWLFLGSYKHLRKHLLESATWNHVARLGPRAFETITGEVVNVALITLTQAAPDPAAQLAGLDVANERTPATKATALTTAPPTLVSQQGQLGNPDWRVTLDDSEKGILLHLNAVSLLGLGTCDAPHYVRCFWELRARLPNWSFMQTASQSDDSHTGQESIVAWDSTTSRVYGMSAEERRQGHNQDYRGSAAWGKKGVAVSLIRNLRAAPYSGELFDKSIAVIVPKRAQDLEAVSAFCFSEHFQEAVRRIDQKVMVTNSTLVKVPFDLAHWQQVAAERYPEGLPKPFSSDPTQWLFNGHPAGADDPLQVAVARLLGYRWPRQTGSSFPDCPALEADGLEPHADEDGIVCLHERPGEPAAAPRLLALLAAAYGADWCATRLEELLAAAGFAGRSLEDWLRDGFFKQHCERFHQRPFIWHLWDGLPGGFSALVNYHQLAAPNGGGRRTLEKLTYNVLGDWINRQQEGVRTGVGGADDRLAAALELKKRLEAILHGEPPFDLFIRWKPLHQQPLGWEPDLNDGVRLNLRPFLASNLPNGPRGAGILRAKPNVNWSKDRGKEPESARPPEDYPWFWTPNGKTFHGDRHNDLHLTRAEKEAARQR